MIILKHLPLLTSHTLIHLSSDPLINSPFIILNSIQFIKPLWPLSKFAHNSHLPSLKMRIALSVEQLINWGADWCDWMLTMVSTTHNLWPNNCFSHLPVLIFHILMRPLLVPLANKSLVNSTRREYTRPWGFSSKDFRHSCCSDFKSQTCIDLLVEPLFN